MCRLTHPLGHLLLSLYLHIHIPGSGLDGPDQSPFSDLHRLYLPALLRQFLQRRLHSCDLAYTACGHKREVGREKLICLPRRQFTPVETDFRHLALLQSLIYLLYVPVLYGSTNHILISTI